MTILKCLFNNSTLRVADEFNDIVNLGTLFKFIFDFLQCFSRVQSTLVDDTICIVNILNHFVGETATAQADNVDAAESDRFASCNNIRRNILAEAATALNHYMTAYMTELVHQYIGTNNSVIINHDFTCHFGRVPNDTSVTNQRIVCHVYTFH